MQSLLARLLIGYRYVIALDQGGWLFGSSHLKPVSVSPPVKFKMCSAGNFPGSVSSRSQAMFLVRLPEAGLFFAVLCHKAKKLYDPQQ